MKAPGTPPAHGGRPAGGRAEHCGSERAGPGWGLGGEKACGATGKGRSPALAQDPSHRCRPLVREPPGGPRASWGLSVEAREERWRPLVLLLWPPPPPQPLLLGPFLPIPEERLRASMCRTGNRKE